MPNYPFPTRPPGICGAVYPSPRGTEEVFPYTESERLFASADGKAAMGLTVRPPREHLGLWSSASADMASIGVSMGMFYEPSLLEERPHDAHAVVDNPGKHCNGLYLAAGYSNGILTIVTSPYGSYPLYYMEQDGGLLFSTSIRDLLACMKTPPQHRPAGIAQWLAIDRFVDGGTVWEGIERFQAASIYTFDTASVVLRQQRYWELAFGEKSDPGAVEHVAEAFTDAVRRIADRGMGNVAAALTGGLDSRVIWSVLAKEYPDVTAATHYMVDGTDITIAKQVAKRLGITHHACKIGEEFTGAFETSLMHTLLTANGTPSAENAHVPHIYDYHVPWADTLIDGINASLERNISMRRIVPASASHEQIAEQTYRWLRHDDLIALLDPGIRKEYEGLARQAVSAAYMRCDTGLPPKVRADEFYVRFMEPNYRNDMALLQFYYNQFAAPFFDLKYTDAITALREDIRAAQPFQDMLVRKCAPQLRHMPRSHTDVRTLPVKNWKLQLLPLAFDRYIGLRLERTLPVKLKPYVRLRRPSMVLDGVFRTYLDINLDSILRGLPDGFDAAASERFLRGYLAGAHSGTPVVGQLLAMCSPWSVLSLDKKE